MVKVGFVITMKLEYFWNKFEYVFYMGIYDWSSCVGLFLMWTNEKWKRLKNDEEMIS